MVASSSDEKDRFLLLYASETGQAKSIAEEISECAAAHSFLADVNCVSGVDKKFRLEAESVVVIVASTTGDGEPPETARKFWRRIKKRDLPSDHLAHLRFAVLGLGDTNYTQFCNFGRSVNRRLLELGATCLAQPGFADDAVGLELTVEPWIERLWPALHEQFSSIRGKTLNCGECARISGARSATSETGKMDDFEGASLLHSPRLEDVSLTVPPKPHEFLSIEFVDPVPGKADYEHHVKKPPSVADGSCVFRAHVVGFKQLTSLKAEKQKYEISFAVPESVEWREGDSFGLFCPNSAAEVEYLLSRLRVGAEDACSKHYVLTKNEESKKKIPENLPVSNCSLKYALTWCCNLRAPLKKAFLQVLADFCAEEKEKRRLLELSSRQGAAEYSAFVSEPGLDLLDILKNFPSCEPTVERVLEFLPRLLPRPYSAIYSSSESKILRFAFSLVDLRRCDSSGAGCGRRAQQGLCTGWMVHEFGSDASKAFEQLKISDEHPVPAHLTVRLYKRKSTNFHLPVDALGKPLVMIGPGTGIAPFLGFLAERRRRLVEARERSAEFKPAPCWLLFGCREPELDFVYEEDVRNFVKEGVLDVACVAASKACHGFVIVSDESVHCSEDVLGTGSDFRWKYVQDVVRHYGQVLSGYLIEKCGSVYVCGDAVGMGKGVKEAFAEILVQYSGDGEGSKSGEEHVRRLVDELRYLEDIWS